MINVYIHTQRYDRRLPWHLTRERESLEETKVEDDQCRKSHCWYQRRILEIWVPKCRSNWGEREFGGDKGRRREEGRSSWRELFVRAKIEQETKFGGKENLSDIEFGGKEKTTDRKGDGLEKIGNGCIFEKDPNGLEKGLGRNGLGLFWSGKGLQKDGRGPSKSSLQRKYQKRWTKN